MSLGAHDRALRQRVRSLVTPALLAEAADRPEGPYSRDLTEVMDFVRRNPDPDRPRYLIVAEDDGFRVAERNPARGGSPRLDPGPRLPTRAAAEHAVLLRRLADHGLLPEQPGPDDEQEEQRG